MPLPFHEEHIEAWWFASGDRLAHGDDRLIVLGEAHSLTGTIGICANALHAARDPAAALPYATTLRLYKVRVWGDVIEDDEYNKIGARHRQYIAMRDAENMLLAFARQLSRSAESTAGRAWCAWVDAKPAWDGDDLTWRAWASRVAADPAASKRFNEHAYNLFGKGINA